MTIASTNNRWKYAIKSLFGLGLLLGLASFVEFDRLTDSFFRADHKLLWLGFLLFSLQGAFESGRLKIVYACFNIGHIESIRLFFVGLFFGNFMPGPIGADIYQVYHMQTIHPGLIRPVSLSVFLRLNGLFINLSMALFALSIGSKPWVDSVNIQSNNMILPSWFNFMILAAAALTIALAFSSWGRSQLKSIYVKTRGVVQEFKTSFRSFTVGQHISIIVLGVLVILTRVACFFVLVKAFGSSMETLDLIIVVTVTALATLLPVSFGGLGVREISLSALFIALGLSPTNAIAISLISRCFIWALSIVGGGWFILGKTHNQIHQ